jgi:hypothetical protein
MPLKISVQELDHVFQKVGAHASGASVGRLLQDPGLGIKKRTLQRRLDHLVAQGRLQPQGEGRGRRYVVVLDHEWEPDVGRSVLREDPHGLVLSPESIHLRALVEQPLSRRRPVGYTRSFLGGYIPNKTAYLPETVRKRLQALGRSSAQNVPAGTYLRQVLHRLLIDLSWNSSRLEGNTYSLLETERLLEQSELAHGKNAREAQMILNHKAALEMLSEQAEEIGFNRYTICNLHALLADNLLSDPGACGRLRMRSVGISGTVFHPLEGPQLVASEFDAIMEKAEMIEDAYEQAFFVMVHLPYLQPFEDVNKRVSRLAANIPLIQRNLCPLSFVDVPQSDYIHGLIAVYELNRVEYLRDVFIWAVERSCARYAAVTQSLGEPDLFRLRYRQQVGHCVASVVRSWMKPGQAARWLAQHVKETIPTPDQRHFLQMVETELTHLHEGNFARYRLRPAEFEAWRRQWS